MSRINWVTVWEYTAIRPKDVYVLKDSATVRSSLHLAPSRTGQEQPSYSWGPRVRNAASMSTYQLQFQKCLGLPKLRGDTSNPTALLDPGTVWRVKHSPGCEITSLSSSLLTCSRCKPPPAPVPREARWASWGARRAAGANCWPARVPAPPPVQCEAAVLSCRYSRYWIKRVCCCRQTPGTVLARAVFGLAFPGPYQEPPLVTQPVPELTLTFTLRQGLAEHLKGKKMEALRVQMFMPCSFESLYL